MKQMSHSTFEDLEVYQVAREFRKAMYKVAKRLPDFEKFALASQIRRAAASLTNNIAEGRSVHETFGTYGVSGMDDLTNLDLANYE